ncbi:diguanylate cyclase domain-containing protein [Hyphomicrobium sp.]|uniref:diguanylate cyclase domain-containing protein n=1 Tax=Hyphomicrobium sp. TaxID=82 RepID=UPI00356B29F0
MVKFATFVQTIKRHPLTSAFDLSLTITTMAIGVTLALAYDLEELWSDITPRERTICSEELFALGLLFALCATIFIWRRLLEERQDRTKRVLAESELQEQRSLAMADALTGLPNRREFLRCLQVSLDRSAHPTVYLLDLNGFKAINDQFGHACGDEVLKVVALRFKAAARSEDLVARLGGDEFAVLAPSLPSRKQEQSVALRFVQALSDGIEIDSRLHFIGVAIGVASAPLDGSTSTELLQSADMAMYDAKEASHSAVSFFADVKLGQTA